MTDDYETTGLPDTTGDQLELLSPPDGGPIVVNSSCLIYEQEGVRAVMIGGVPVYHYAEGDVPGRAALRGAGYASWIRHNPGNRGRTGL